jgi:O-antigen ligase
MPFISAFALNPWVPLPLIYIIAAFIVYVLLSSHVQQLFYSDDFYLLMMIVAGLIGMSLVIEYTGTKNLNHVAALSMTILFFYIVVRSLIAKLSFEKINSVLVLSLLMVSIFVIIEFIATNYFGVNFLKIIPYTRNDLSEALTIGNLARPRGFAEEAGHMAMFYELVLPLSVIYFRNKSTIVTSCYYLLIFTSFILLFSSAAIVSLILATFTILFLNFYKKQYLFALVILLMIILIFFSSNFTQFYLEGTIFKKLQIFLSSSQQTDISVITRSERYSQAFIYFISSPFVGIGWGTVSQLAVSSRIYAGVVSPGGFISLYAEILVASGVIGLTMFVLFLFRKIIRLMHSRDPASNMLLISILSLLLHYGFVSNYWFPMLWFSLGLADNMNYKKLLI